MPGVFLFIGEVIATAIAGVGAVIAGIASTVGAALSGVIATVTKVAGSVLSSVGAILKGAISTIGKIAGALSKGLTKAITAIANIVDKVTAPILNPIKKVLTWIDNKVTSIETWVKTTMKPVADAVEVAHKAAELKVMYDLVTNSDNILKAMQHVGAGITPQTATAITRTWRGVVDMGINILDAIDNVTGVMGVKVDGVRDKLVELVADTTDKLGIDITRIERRVTDRGWFIQMLIEALQL